ncbi:heterogeneous nuclear ribonucleoprotein 1-like [Quillaja saponaria]|uniref:Heterogeneous nuclear ribonucleoprotein 1-like n=1 Tax=Quillaja saponaria TaxID=32244 RepID=A0AAD7L770_QUISA|nr:heterogeneous nuclear ribonucleoprotein 1-like [Quillaja saponaria]
MDSKRNKLFVGGIPKEMSEATLKEHFNKLGEVEESLIITDKNTGNARGFGFVTFKDPLMADKALEEEQIIMGKKVDVKPAEPKCRRQSGNNGDNTLISTKKIFVGGLPTTLTEVDFKSYFESFGAITDFVIMKNPKTKKPRGFGFITYASGEAVDNVLQKRFHELNMKIVEVKRAVRKEMTNNHISIYNIYDRGLDEPFGNIANYSPFARGSTPYYDNLMGYYYGFGPMWVYPWDFWNGQTDSWAIWPQENISYYNSNERDEDSSSGSQAQVSTHMPQV